MGNTSTPDYLKKVIYDLLLYRRSSLGDTEWFRQQQHNKDLCPLLELQLERIIDMFDRYHRTVKDIQGLRDRGVDVIISYGSQGEEREEWRRIGFQVKSYEDLTEHAWLTKLKAQCFEAQTRGLTDHYVVICTDAVEHKDKLRSINAELVEMPGLTVVGPAHAYTFLHLADHEMAAYIKAKLDQDDVVYNNALLSVSHLTPTEAAIVIELLARNLFEDEPATSIDSLKSASFVVHTYNVCPDIERWFYFGEKDDAGSEYGSQELMGRGSEDRFDEDFMLLDEGQIASGNRNNTVTVQSDNYRAIQALMLDATVRNNLSPLRIRHFILESLMGKKLKKGIEFKAAIDES